VFRPLYTAEEMRAAEAGHDVEEMMERAGRAVADAVLAHYPEAQNVCAVCGKGANGGDGRIALGLLRDAGRETSEALDPEADVVIDALFGTGFKGPPRDDAAALIEHINAHGSPVVAVDVPSGVNASTGEVPGAAVRADVTVTMHGPKVGVVVGPGRFLAGQVTVADIGLEDGETEHSVVTDEILGLVPRRGPRDTKYSAGSVLVVGGSPGMTGALCLAAEASFRADAGYVVVSTDKEAMPVVEARLLEAVKRPLDEVDEAAKRASALAIGPGFGRGSDRKQLVARLLAEVELPAVVDADALFELEPGDWPAPRVLTPHSGELARLLGEEAAWVDAHRLEAVRRAADTFRCVVLLKGADTLVAAPGAGVLVCANGLPSLATAGSGDVLTGIVGAFLSKGMDARLAAAAAAAAQQASSRAAEQRAGLVASDLIAALPRVLA
jgi:ADP-dependent NAD(P)H-hydrate dehydratase / NAD(P)H-hydrate epimerase